MGASACPAPAGSEDYNDRGTAWKPMVIAAFACTCATIAISGSLIALHIRRYRAPKEQRQIIRIACSVAIYAVVAFFEIYSYEAAQYIDPIGDVYESFGLCALFLLFIQYAAPDGGSHADELFSAVKAAEETEKSYDWPRIFWICVFQYPLVEICSVIIVEITQALGTYCVDSLKPQFAHLWVELLESAGISICVVAILAFRNNMKLRFKVRRSLAKIISFKIIVFIRFAQAWAFSTLLSYDLISTSSSFKYNDILWGIPGLCTCVEMVLFACGFWYAFSSTEYSSTAKPSEQPLPWWKAILHVLNPSDLFIGIAKIFPLCGQVHRSGEWKNWSAAQQQKPGEAVRKLKSLRLSRKGQGTDEGPYQQSHGSTEALSKPVESWDRGRSASGATQPGAESYPMTDMSGQDLYRPPSTTPPNQTSTHLMAQPYLGDPRSPHPGQWNGQRYDRTLSPAVGYGEQPTQGREMV
ncbi:hypothetical protein LTR36_003599 [Oleoguttula mirabilis]|uniref:Uncharacterized protein n=1 Tax=Oleoguttula mirabilis TaxID=1507867 RepID=A0AAV9JI09_9PEZI|nr:hypothetical protein LTR36_003599 [Oleoguttula mirabilis]